MRLSHQTGTSRVGLACGTVLLLLLSSILAMPLGARSIVAPRAPPSTAFGPATVARELGAAERSLATEERAGTHPATLPPTFSPGGYAWMNLTGRLALAPTGLIGAEAAWDPVDGYVLLFGGEVTGGTGVADTWSFSNGTWSNLTGSVHGTPPALTLGGLAYDPSGREMVLYGGVNSTGQGETQTWTYRDFVWTNLTGHTGATPPVRLFGTMTTDTAAGEVLLFGGLSANWLTDTWSFRAGNWTNLTSTSSFPAGLVVYPCASDDPAAGGVLLYAPYNPSGTLLEPGTFLYSGGNWRNLSALTSGQTADQILGSAEYLASISSVAFVSGATYRSTTSVQIAARTAEYSNETWTNVTSVVGGPPDIGELAAISGLAGGQGILAFGGTLNINPLAYTWVLSAPLAARVGASHLIEDVGTSDSFTSSLSGGYGPVSYHWNFGDGTTASVAAPAHAFARAGAYEVNLSASDVLGHVGNASLWVQVEPPLSATTSADPSPAVAGGPVALVGSWTGGTAPYTFSWSLGDLNSSSASSLAHTYAKAGNYTVQFTVTDALGASAAAGLTLSVQAAPSTSPSGSSSVSLTSGTGLYLLLGIVLLAIVAAVLGVLLARRPKAPSGPPVPYAGAPPSAAYGGPGGPPPTGPPPAT